MLHLDLDARRELSWGLGCLGRQGRKHARAQLRRQGDVRKKAYSQDLQRSGRWVHIWRIAGQYSNLSVFDVADNDALHDVLWALPLFPYMKIEVLPLAQHPSAI